MSGPDAGRGPDGGEHPLDVDARFADIIAHFHDDEPTRPTVVDGYADPEGTDDSTSTGSRTGEDGTASPSAGRTPPEAPDREHPDREPPAPGADAARPDAARPDAASTVPPERAAPSADPVRDLSAPADLAAMRRSYEARIAAEVDRAVDGPDGGHFVPAEPPPLPRPDLPGRLAWTAVLAGPVLLLLCALLWRSVPSWVLGSIVTAVVVGFGYLVWRLPRTRDRDDPGDGAIV
ncbi:hypothetical protein [Aquipuribacter sp. MA13-6]|uniref:hypothetical protein n=1 Tax=unclassified Aquipuribacter TaxID=2635084 RepID=UPI003EE82381